MSQYCKYVLLLSTVHIFFGEKVRVWAASSTEEGAANKHYRTRKS